MIILGFETSCDDTSVAVIDDNRVLSNIISTQLIHKEFGGVVPELASREHLKLIQHIVNQALFEANITLDDIDAYAVTYGPGLIGAVLVGLNFVKGLAVANNKPFVGVNHMEGHIAANYLSHPELTPPYICLLCSGGHTQLVHVKDWTEFKILGSTKDDAIGEAFDKVAKILDLGFPGGPYIDKAAKDGDMYSVDFTTPYIQNDHLDFSYSGLKTAVLNYVNSNKDYSVNNVAASFQRAAIDSMIIKVKRSVKQSGIKRVAIAGGVSANSYLRQQLTELKEKSVDVFMPELQFCTDNAAMIAKAGQIRLNKQETSKLQLQAKPVLSLERSQAYE